MSLGDVRVIAKLKAYAHLAPTVTSLDRSKPKRTAPFDQEPGYHVPAGLWLYGNVKLLEAPLAYVPQSLGPPNHRPGQLDELQRLTEELVLDSKIIVCGVHNCAHQRVAVVPLRWGSPRIVVLSGGFHFHLGTQLETEPFRAARLWRYQWDPRTDLAISRRDPDKLPTFATFNSTVDKMIERIATDKWPGLRFKHDEELRVLV